MILLCLNDCRQIGPVIKNGNRQDIVNASINSSHLWSKFTKFKLDTNMRLVGSSSNLNDDFTLKQNQYADLILDIGNGENDSICYDCIEGFFRKILALSYQKTQKKTDSTQHVALWPKSDKHTQHKL